MMYAPARPRASARPSIPTTPSGSGATGAEGEELVPVGKAYFGFTDEELRQARPLRPQPHRQPLRPGARGRVRQGQGPRARGRLRGPAALDAAQIRRRHALSPHPPHPLGQAAARRPTASRRWRGSSRAGEGEVYPADEQAKEPHREPGEDRPRRDACRGRRWRDRRTGRLVVRHAGTRAVTRSPTRLRACVRRAASATASSPSFCRHTSASLTIQENADPDVRTDLLTALDRLAPAHAPATCTTPRGPTTCRPISAPC